MLVQSVDKLTRFFDRSFSYIYEFVNTHTQGAIIQSSLSEEDSKEHAALLSSLTEKASILVGTLDPDDELNFLRVRSKKKEIMIAPEGSFVLVVIQNPNATID